MTTMPKAISAAGKAAHHAASHGFLDGFTWAQGATIVAAVLAAVIAVIGYTIQRKISRRAERADLYGNAIASVEAYLEAPYRIRRKIDDPGDWFTISSSISDAKTAMSHQQALLEMHAPQAVATAYKDFASAAIAEAGPQMTDAWSKPVVTAPTQIPLGAGNAYSRVASDAKRTTLVDAMATDLAAVGSWWKVWH